ncbi:hypothetical protein P7C70_g4006, partial [Phenoliferia sp. Uapishka_3]
MSGFLQKIAHNNRVSLGPKDIKTLAELISSEKRVVEGTQRLSTERSRSSAALKEWGVSEGPDLGDVLTKMSQLFDSLSSAELAFAQHDANFRLAFKSVRTKEENLAQLKRNQSSLASKIDSQEKRVSKMKEENKDLPNATVKLREMRDEMAGLENTVMNEETRLGDYKRSTTREAMSLKLGALLELAEKAIIIGEIGKLIVDEIPVEQTEPGAPRARYQAFDRTEQHMNEATRCLGEVVFNPTPLSPSQGNYEDRVGSNEEPRGGAAAYEAPGEYNQSTFASQQNSAGAFGSQQYGEPATPNSGAPYSSNYGDYPGNGQDGERDDQGPSQYGYQSESLQPGGLPIIRHASPLVGADALPEIDTPTGEYNPTSSPFGKNKALLGGVSRYEQEPNRSSLAYMDDNGEDYEQRQADEEAAEERLREEEDSRRQEEHTPRNETVDVRGPRPLPSLNLPDHIRHSPYLDQVTSPTNMTSPTQMTSPSSNYAEPTMIPVVIPDVAPAPSSMFAATRPSKPGMIRGESALGSKHGDIYVAGTNGSNNGGLPPPVSAPFQGSGTSGYNSRSGGDSSSITSGSGAAGRINAGAFRRAPPQPSYSLPPTQQGDSRYPSQADSIREAYYAQSQAQSGAQDYIESPRGSIVEADSPRFDISPLHVQKRQERQVRTPLYAGGSGHDG